MSTIAEKLVQLNDAKTGIKNAIEAKGVTVGDAPLAEYADKISQIEGGGGDSKFGLSMDSIIGEVDSAGYLTAPDTSAVLDLTGVKTIGSGALAKRFETAKITGILAPDLREIAVNGMGNAFAGSVAFVGEASFPKLSTIQDSGMVSAFSSSNITAFLAPNLTEIVGAGCYNVCYGALRLTSVNLDSLMKVGNTGLSGAFTYSKIKRIDFPALYTVGTNAFGSSASNYIFYSCSELTEIHFNKAAQPQIEALKGYDVKWGATNATIYFDL